MSSATPGARQAFPRDVGLDHFVGLVEYQPIGNPSRLLALLGPAKARRACPLAGEERT